MDRAFGAGLGFGIAIGWLLCRAVVSKFVEPKRDKRGRFVKQG